MALVDTETVARQPDISYQPDFEKYQARTRLRLQNEKLNRPNLPPKFPQQLDSDLVWEGETLADSFDWNYVLGPEQIQELEHALTYFKSQYLWSILQARLTCS